jgi:hypothetical protein
MSQAKQAGSVVHVDPLAVGITVLAVASALIHLYVGISLGPPSARPFPLLFYLNAIGYLVLAAAFNAPQLHAVHGEVRWVFIAFTVLTIVLWFLLAPVRIPLGYGDKVIEAVLVLLLFLDNRRSQRDVGVNPTT